MSSLPAFDDSGLPAPGASVKVRAARIRDWSRLQGLLLSLFPEIDEATFGHWLRVQRHSLAVALTADGLVGVVRMDVQPGSRVTLLSSLGVAERARGQGVARALLKYCEEVACACNAPTLAFDVAADDAGPQAFLRHLGYVDKGSRQEPFHPGRCDFDAEMDVRRWTLEVRPPVWPTWQLKREHAPRVPPAAIQRLVMRALYGAWLGATGRTA